LLVRVHLRREVGISHHPQRYVRVLHLLRDDVLDPVDELVQLKRGLVQLELVLLVPTQDRVVHEIVDDVFEDDGAGLLGLDGAFDFVDGGNTLIVLNFHLLYVVLHQIKRHHQEVEGALELMGERLEDSSFDAVDELLLLEDLLVGDVSHRHQQTQFPLIRHLGHVYGVVLVLHATFLGWPLESVSVVLAALASDLEVGAQEHTPLELLNVLVQTELPELPALPLERLQILLQLEWCVGLHQLSEDIVGDAGALQIDHSDPIWDVCENLIDQALGRFEEVSALVEVLLFGLLRLHPGHVVEETDRDMHQQAHALQLVALVRVDGEGEED